MAKPRIGYIGVGLMGHGAASGIEQPHHAGLDDVVDLDRRRQRSHHVVSDAFHERREIAHAAFDFFLTGCGVHIQAPAPAAISRLP